MGARDEYYTYLPQVDFLAKNNEKPDVISEYLFQIETERMGLNGNIENCRKVALKIMNKKKELFKTS